MKKASLLVIFLTVFIDLIGFGIVLPLLPRYSERFGAQGFEIGLIIGSFSLMQLFLAPMWGRLSDRIGRRPVLLLSVAGSAVSYAMFAVAALFSGKVGLGILVASRIFAGACGANLSVASAYIADVTTAENRSKGMALIGVAFGLGFILGPVLSALSASAWGLAAPGWVAAALCMANFILGWFILRESLRPDSGHAAQRPNLAQWGHTLGLPRVGLLVGIYFLSTFCFACFESTLPLFVGSSSLHSHDLTDPSGFATELKLAQDPVARQLRSQMPKDLLQELDAATTDPAKARALRRPIVNALNRLLRSPALFDAASRAGIPHRPEAQAPASIPQHGEALARLNRLLLEDAFPNAIERQRLYFDERHLGYLFAFVGLVTAFIQGGVIGRLVKRFGEAQLIFGSLVLIAVSLVVISDAARLWSLLVGLAVFATGSATNRAPTMGLISLNSPAAEQGATLGVAQSAGTLARVMGPPFATTLFAWHPPLPYLICAAIALGTGLLAWWFLCRRSPPVTLALDQNAASSLI